jgi:hypothetical protein
VANDVGAKVNECNNLSLSSVQLLDSLLQKLFYNKIVSMIVKTVTCGIYYKNETNVISEFNLWKRLNSLVEKS